MRPVFGDRTLEEVNQVEIRLLGWPQSNLTGVPTRRGNLDTEGRPREDMAGRWPSASQGKEASREKPTLPTAGSGTSGLYNCEE